MDGLLPFVSSAFSDAHVSQFRGKHVAIDASGWLHRGAQACTKELALGHETHRFLGFALRMLKLLQAHGVSPVFVFDGASLPMKERTRRERAERREAARQQGISLLEMGRTAEASGAFAKAATVTSAMARQLIVILRRQRIAYVIAPYEADAQLCLLVSRGHCACAITEDSDLLAYSCPTVLYKLDANGYGRLASFAALQWAEAGGRQLFDGSFPDEWRMWESHLFLDMCILAGTDHIVGVPGVGVKTAHALLRRYKSLDACLKHLLPAGDARNDFQEHALRVRGVFRSQLIWDPETSSVRSLSPMLSPLSTLDGEAGSSAPCDHLGTPIDDPVLARQICIDATVDPVTLEEVDLSVVGSSLSSAARGLQPPGLALPPAVPLPPPSAESRATHVRESAGEYSTHAELSKDDMQPTGSSTASVVATSAADRPTLQAASASCASARSTSLSAASEWEHALAACAWGGTVGIGCEAEDRGSLPRAVERQQPPPSAPPVPSHQPPHSPRAATDVKTTRGPPSRSGKVSRFFAAAPDAPGSMPESSSTLRCSRDPGRCDVPPPEPSEPQTSVDNEQPTNTVLPWVDLSRPEGDKAHRPRVAIPITRLPTMSDSFLDQFRV